jgi:hypothetical protein
MARRLPPVPSGAELLRLYRVTARKQLSQNFLLDPRLTGRFVSCISCRPRPRAQPWPLGARRQVREGGGPTHGRRRCARGRPWSRLADPQHSQRLYSHRALVVLLVVFAHCLSGTAHTDGGRSRGRCRKGPTVSAHASCSTAGYRASFWMCGCVFTCVNGG